MSSFQASFDDSIVDSHNEDSRDETPVQNASADDHQEPKDSMPRSSSQAPMALARLNSSAALLPHLAPQQHSTLFYLSLIEGRCRTQAANAINARHSPEDQLPESHPEVLDLTRHLFGEMTKELHKAGILPDEFAGQELSELRRTYLSSFDAILHNIASKQAQDYTSTDRSSLAALDLSSSTRDIYDRQTYSSLDESDGFAVNAIVPTQLFSNSHAIALRSTMASNRLLQAQMSNPLSLILRDDHTEQTSMSVYKADYKQLSLLGKGGFGRVYKVFRRLDKRQYAVKKVVIRAEKLKAIRANDKLETILRELQTLATLEHKNVVRYYHSWVEFCPPRVSRIVGEHFSSDSDSDDEEEEEEESDDQKFGSKKSRSKKSELDLQSLTLDELLRRDDRERLDSEVTEESLKDLVMFEDSIPAKPAGPSQTPSHSNEARALVEAHKSTFYRPGDDSGSEDSDGDARYGVLGQDLALYIQMALHPLSLEDYLWPEQQKSNNDIALQHCYHTIPSVRILLAILDGIEYVHSQSFVHRDLKPANIFLSVQTVGSASEGSVRIGSCPDCAGDDPGKQAFITPHIGDFGLVAGIKDTALTSSPRSSLGNRFEPTTLATISTPPGTRFYLPPKEKNGGTVICPKWDVYSLGVIAFEMIQKFGTKTERHVVLNSLCEGIFPDEFEEHEMAGGIKAMLCRERENRWDCPTTREWLKGFVEKTT